MPLSNYLMVSAILFTIGLFGALTKRNLIMVFMSIELMLNAVGLNFVAFSAYTPIADAVSLLRGQIFAIFIIVVAACEIGVGLGIVLLLFRQRKQIDIDKFDLLKE